MQFRDLLATMRRRLLTGVVTFVVVALASGMLASRPTATPTAEPTPTITGAATGWFLQMRFEPAPVPIDQQKELTDNVLGLSGVWLTDLGSEKHLREAMRGSSLSEPTLGAPWPLWISQPNGWLVQLNVREPDKEKATVILRQWQELVSAYFLSHAPSTRSGSPGIVITKDFTSVTGIYPQAEQPVKKTADTAPLQHLAIPLALLLGLLSGIAAMFLHDSADRRIGRGLRQAPGAVVLPEADRRAGAEGIRALRAALIETGAEVFAFVATKDADTSHDVAAAFAQGMVDAERRTLLLDARAEGPADVDELAEQIGGRQEALVQVGLASLPELADIAASPRLEALLQECLEHFQTVVLDAGVITPSSAALPLAHLGSPILVTRVGEPENRLVEATRLLGGTADMPIAVTVAR